MTLALVTSVLVPPVIAVLMFGLGASLAPDDFSRALRSPVALLIGLLCQLRRSG